MEPKTDQTAMKEIAQLLGDGAPSPVADRRITRRFLDAWAQSARGEYPSWRAMREADLGDDWEWVFAVDLKFSVEIPYFVYLGARLARLADVYLPGDDRWRLSLLGKAALEIHAAVAAEGPHLREDEITLLNGKRILFRCLTAPFADNGRTITHVAGVVSGRLAE
jgi:hypothetical protein